MDIWMWEFELRHWPSVSIYTGWLFQLMFIFNPIKDGVRLWPLIFFNWLLFKDGLKPPNSMDVFDISFPSYLSCLVSRFARSCELPAGLQRGLVGRWPAGYHLLWFGVSTSAGDHCLAASNYRTASGKPVFWIWKLRCRWTDHVYYVRGVARG